MKRGAFRSYREFWAFYVGEHRRPLTRRLHFVGTTGAISCIAGAIFSASVWLLMVAPVIAYSFAWAGHLWVEKNSPATFKFSLWSLIADIHMYALMLAGRMDDEVRRIGE
jgi:hypothetical protein